MEATVLSYEAMVGSHLVRSSFGAFALIVLVLLPLLFAVILNRSERVEYDPIQTATTRCMQTGMGCSGMGGR